MAAKTLQEQIDALNARIEADVAKRDALRVQLANEAALASIAAGARVIFAYGRAESRFKATGTVVGVQDTDKGRKIRVAYGEGMDSNVVTITPADVQHVYSAGSTDVVSAGQVSVVDNVDPVVTQ